MISILNTLNVLSTDMASNQIVKTTILDSDDNAAAAAAAPITATTSTVTYES